MKRDYKLYLNDIKDKIVLITGSSNGIGKETALAFSNEKCKIVITYNKDKKSADETAKKCLSLGASDVIVIQLDVTKDKNIEFAVKEIILKYRKIDFLINNAGIANWHDFKDQSFDDIELQLRTNLEGLIKMTSACISHIKQGIVNISSGAGKTGYEDLTVYCATKFGVRGFTQALSQAYPSLLIVSVNPGMTATRMTNFQGIHPKNVAKVILDTVKGKIKPDQYKDVDVWRFV